MTKDPAWHLWLWLGALALCLVGLGLMLVDGGVGGGIFGAIAAALAAFQAGRTYERRNVGPAHMAPAARE